MNRQGFRRGLAGAAGLFLGFPNPLLHLPLLSLLYPAALYLLGRDAPDRRSAFRHGWLTGLAGAAAALYWLALPIHNVGGLPWALAVPCAVGIGIYVGLYGGVFCVCAHVLRTRPPLTRGVMLGLIWYLLELLRGTLLTGFPWLPQAAAFVPWPLFIQGASLVGAYALGGLLAMIACLLAEGRASCVIVAVALLLGLAGYGAARLNASDAPAGQAAMASCTVPVIFVEGNIDQNQKWEPALQQNTVDLYLRLSRTALLHRQGPPPLIIWPETAMPFYYQEHRLYTPVLRAFAREFQASLLLGAPGYLKNGDRSFRIFNRAYLVDARGTDVGYYDKEHLVPFGEYLPPWVAFDFLKPLLQGIGDFTPGLAVAPLRSGNLALGMLICYESIFPELAQARVAAGANILVNISNDGWFGDSSAPEQHLQMTALRAVEQNRWLLRGTNTGISGIYDDRGRLVVRGTQFKAQSLAGEARLRSATSPYHRIASRIPYVAAVLLLLLLICTPGRAPRNTP